MMSGPVRDAERLRAQRRTFYTFLFFSAFEIGALASGLVSLATWGGWIVLFGAFFFPVMAVISLVGILKNWTVEQEDRAFTRTFGYIFGVPIILVAFILAGWVLFSTFGWLASIPSWAAVIIVLLVLLLLK
jgi:Ca2+/Na+ antiporter